MTPTQNRKRRNPQAAIDGTASDTSKPIQPAEYVRTEAAFDRTMKHLRQQQMIAIDTESNSMYAYHGRICLIQLSTPTRDAIVDPLELNNLSALGDILADPAVEKIMHGAEYDLVMLRQDYDFHVANLFDTMIAARLLKYEKFGLGNLLDHFFGVDVDKSHQKDNWGQRPLPVESLRYAQMDTHYLIRLRHMMETELKQRGLAEEAYNLFADEADVSHIQPRPFDEDGYWRLGKPMNLTRRQMAVLRELYLLRDGLARERDVPPYRVFSNCIMVSLAQQQPRNLTDLGKADGIPSAIVRLYGEGMVDAIEAGVAVRKPPRAPSTPKADPIVSERYIDLHTWRKTKAAERDLDASLILPKQVMMALAEDPPASLAEMRTITGLSDWRIERYGDAILDIMHPAAPIDTAADIISEDDSSGTARKL